MTFITDDGVVEPHTIRNPVRDLKVLKAGA
jgi:hypothetical protein